MFSFFFVFYLVVVVENLKEFVMVMCDLVDLEFVFEEDWYVYLVDILSGC